MLGFTLWSIPFVFIVWLGWLVIRSRRNAAKAAALGCKAALPPESPWWDFYGIQLIFGLLSAKADGTLIDWLTEGFDAVGRRVGRHVDVAMSRTFVGKVMLTRSPKNIQALLATSFKDFELDRNRVAAFQVLLGTGIFSANGAKWAHSRALLKPAFSKNQVSDLDVEERHSQNLMRALPVGEDGWTGDVDLQVLFYRLTIDSSTEFLFGESVDSQLHELPPHLKPSDLRAPKTQAEKVFAKAFDQAQEFLANKLVFQDFHWLYQPRGLHEACKNCHDFVDFYVRRALSQNEKEEQPTRKYIFLDELAKETRDPIELRSELINVLLAGRDTTASLLGFLYAILARNPEMYKRLRQKVIEHFGTYNESQEITFSSLKDCQYLQYCLNETLRLYPSVPVNFRMANKDTVLPTGGGPTGESPVFVPKGTNVLYSVAVMHRDPTIWGKDADEFIPERWISRSSTWSYLPFNGGPRICLGQQFALTSAGFVVVRMMQKFDGIHNLDHTRILQHQTLTACSKNGVKVRLHSADD